MLNKIEKIDMDNKKNTIFASLSDIKCHNCNKLLTKAFNFTGFFICSRCGCKTFFVKGSEVSEDEFKKFNDEHVKLSEKADEK